MFRRFLITLTAAFCLVHTAHPQSLTSSSADGTVGLVTRRYHDSISNKPGCILIVWVRLRSPADLAGLHGGDCIVAVDDFAVEGTAETGIPNLHGPVGSTVTYTVRETKLHRMRSFRLMRGPVPTDWETSLKIGEGVSDFVAQESAQTPSEMFDSQRDLSFGAGSIEQQEKMREALQKQSQAQQAEQAASVYQQGTYTSAPQLSTIGGRWRSVAFNRDYEYSFAPDGTYEFSKTSLFQGARVTISGRGTYQVNGTQVFCHQTAVDAFGRPGRLADEYWAYDGARGSLNFNGITLTR